MVPVLVSWDSYNKVPQSPDGLEQWRHIFSVVQDPRHSKPGCQWGWFFFASWRADLFPARPSSWCCLGPWHILAWGCVTPILACLIIWPLPLLSPPLLIRTPALDPRHPPPPTQWDSSLTRLHLRRPYFQTRSRSPGPALRIWTYTLGGQNSARTVPTTPLHDQSLRNE